MGYKLSIQAVVITFSADEDGAELYTADPVYIRKMDKLVQQNPEQFQEFRQEKYEGQVLSKIYRFPKRFISICSKDVKIELTEK